jgi:hypothetical protein
MMAGPAFGDDYAYQIESRILDSFDGDTDTTYVWKVMGSKFSTKTDEDTYPKLAYVATWPSAIFGSNPEGKDLKSLGVWAKYDRRGYNWVDIYPTTSGDDGEDSKPAEIPIPGRAQVLDAWVWGANMNLSLEAYVRDYRGIVHRLPMGSLHFTGWKNMRTAISPLIPQSKRILPRLAPLTFVKFRIWTSPNEEVRDIFIYIDQLKVLTDSFEAHYDGEELADPKRIQELWSGDGSESN